MPYISDRKTTLAKRHYIRKATAWNSWFDFTYSVVQRYRRRYGDDFCLVVNGSTTGDKAYILPFKSVREYFSESVLDDRGRWVGTIIHNQLKIAHAGSSLPVGQYYNRFDLLGQAE